jgi:ABC-type transport system substrate-binding protein
MTAALLHGEVDLVDRLAPWEAAIWQQRRGEYVVGTYRVPSVHLLCVNRASGLTKLRTFRRAMAYALNRQQLLDTLVLRGEKLQGAEILSGPFPRGVQADDPLSYAINPLVRPSPFDPDLAATLFAVAQSEQNASGKADENGPVPMATLRFMYPPSQVARRVVKAIERQWEALGASVVLEELPPGETGWNREYDVLYVEALVSEPLVEARVFLGPQGLAAGNPYLNPLLDELDRSANWSEARAVLHRIHQLVHDDASVIPLWQLPEFYVHHRSLELSAAQPVSLFQDVEQWRLVPRLPPAVDNLWSVAKGGQ